MGRQFHASVAEPTVELPGVVVGAYLGSSVQWWERGRPLELWQLEPGPMPPAGVALAGAVLSTFVEGFRAMEEAVDDIARQRRA